jgi:PAS domain S-box-containing protein
MDTERLRRNIIATQTTLVCRFLPDGVLSFVNNAYATYFHKKHKELIGHSFMSFLAKDEQDKVHRLISSLSKEKPIAIHNCRLLAADGHTRWLQLVVQAIFDKKGNLTELQVEGQDITERKQAEEKLRENEEKYRSLVSNIPDLVWTTDEKWGIVFVGPNAESVLGYTQEEIYKGVSWMVWFDRVYPDDVTRAKAAFRALVEQGKNYDIEYRFKKKDGRWIWLQDRSLGIYEKGGRRYADGLFTDITERKQAEEKIHKFQRRLRSLASQISLTEEQERRRLAICLHDQISQTLAVIRLKLATLQQSSSDGYAKQIASIQELLDQAIQRTRSLTFDLSPPILYELGLEAALEWLAEQFQKQHDIIFKLEDDGKPKPLADTCRGILFMAARELLINIIKHAKAQNVSISIQRAGKKVRVTVQDDGIGFNTSQIERQTNGFGLFSIRERLRHVGGNFNLTSRCGHGTCVTLVAPLRSDRGKYREKAAWQ